MTAGYVADNNVSNSLNYSEEHCLACVDDDVIWTDGPHT